MCGAGQHTQELKAASQGCRIALSLAVAPANRSAPPSCDAQLADHTGTLCGDTGCAVRAVFGWTTDGRVIMGEMAPEELRRQPWEVAIAGSTVLVRNGSINIPPEDTARHVQVARTAIGLTRAGQLILVAAELDPDWGIKVFNNPSKGKHIADVSNKRLAEMMLGLGAREAVAFAGPDDAGWAELGVVTGTPHARGCNSEKNIACEPRTAAVLCVQDDEQFCPSDCHASEGRGRCLAGVCSCENGYEGPDCAIKSCPAGCEESPFGACEQHGEAFLCRCSQGRAGPRCDMRPCQRPCLNGGWCDTQIGQCSCRGLYRGDTCDILQYEVVEPCPKPYWGAGGALLAALVLCGSLVSNLRMLVSICVAMWRQYFGCCPRYKYVRLQTER